MAAGLRSSRFAAAVLSLGVITGAGAGWSGAVDLVGEDGVGTSRTAMEAHVSVCPGGLAAASLAPGDRVYLVGRSQDAHWLELRSPGDLLHTVWIRREHLVPAADVAALPVRECATSGGELVVDQASPVTTTTVADPEAPPTTGTTNPQDTRTSTTAPTRPGPAAPGVSALQPSSRFVYEDIPDCPGPFSLTLSAHITGSDVEVVRVQIRLHGEWTSPIRMTDSDGDQRFTAPVGPFPYPTVADGEDVEVPWRVTAIDAHGSTTTAAAAPAERFTIRSAAACII